MTFAFISRLASLLALGLLLNMGCKSSKQKASPECPFALSYDSPEQEIFLAGGKLTQVDISYEYPAPHIGTPSSVKRDTVKRQEPVSESRLNKVREVVASSGFMKLEKEVYGAPEEARYYPYSLQVNSACAEKKVLYRSNPSFEEEKPPAFDQIVEVLMEITR